jgi:hypothetical protein
VTLTGFLIPALAGAGESSFWSQGDRTVWQPSFTAGLDSHLHTYSLAESDTTESVSEFMVSAAVAGRSSRKNRHRWRVEGEVSAGTELFRERAEAGYRWQGADGRALFRLDGQLRGRQYRSGTEYNLSSDSVEGRLDVRAYPVATRNLEWELRGWGMLTDYRTPSSLEVNDREKGGGLSVRSRGLDGPLWQVGLRQAYRDYPDTSRIDRRTLGLVGQLDHQDLEGQELRLYHKTERRHVRDHTARPSAWSHWTDLQGKVAAGPGQVYLDLQGEIWRYDWTSTIYADSWRVEGASGYAWGDILGTRWQVGLAGEKFAAGDSPESYTALGLQAGVEAYTDQLSGTLSLEFGRRHYQDVEGTGSSLLDEGDLGLYSDFSYWEVWLTASWQLTSAVSLDLLASYEPESHTERDDDVVLGFGTLRLIYRP